MEKKQQLDPALVQEFVTKAHGDFERVKQLIEQESALVNAAWDWGGGDWETGLGAAAHVGHRDIAEYLLTRGARLDIFAAAMLGYIEIVQAMVAQNPASLSLRGPHGIPLLIHAQAGSDRSAEVLAFLKEQMANSRGGGI